MSISYLSLCSLLQLVHIWYFQYFNNTMSALHTANVKIYQKFSCFTSNISDIWRCEFLCQQNVVGAEVLWRSLVVSCCKRWWILNFASAGELFRMHVVYIRYYKRLPDKEVIEIDVIRTEGRNDGEVLTLSLK